MRESAREFFYNFDDLIETNKMVPENIVPKLRTYNINGENIGPNEIVAIVDGLKYGDIEIVKRWKEMLNILAEYLNRTLDSIYENRRDPNQAQHYGDDNYDGPDMIRLEQSMEFIIRMLLQELEPVGKTFDFIGEFDFAMKPDEDMALTSLQRQGIRRRDGSRIYLPKEIIENEIKPNVGIRPRPTRKGGKTRRRHNRRKTNRRKTNRRKTKGR